MKTAKRILSLLMVLLLLLTTLLSTSCKKKKASDDSDGKVATVYGGEEKIEAPPVENYGGRVFNILTLTGSSLLEGVEGDSEAVSSALAARTAWCRETYNIDLQLTTVPDGNDYQTFQNSYLGGLREYDMIVPHPTKFLAAMMASGMMYDLGSCSEIDLSNPWWNQSQVENYNINGKLFFGVSDFNLNKRGFSAFVVNMDKFNALFEDDIHEVIDNGDWTFDKIKEYVLAASEPSDDPNVAEYGYSVNNSVAGFYYWSGEKLLTRNESGNLELKFDVDRCSDIVEKVKGIVVGDQCLRDKYYNSSFANSDTWKAFSGGRLLMMSYDLGAHGNMLREVSFETAYAPTPKFDKDQKEYVDVCSAGFVGIPEDAKDLRCSALVLEALGWHSYYYFRPVYIDTYMQYILSKNENDAKILNRILDNTVYDLGYVLDSQGTTTGLALGMMNAVVFDGAGVASYIEQNERKANNSFQEIIQNIY